jgi:hypothetical protein
MKQHTDPYFRKAAARLERYELSDRDGPVMEVHPLGRKTWRYRYRLIGKREKVTLGPTRRSRWKTHGTCAGKRRRLWLPARARRH